MVNSSALINGLKIVCCIVAMVFLTSCMTPVTRGVSIETESKPAAHAWDYLYFYGGEMPGYGTYSYVLVGRDESNQRATSLYYEVVKAIQGSTVTAKSLMGDMSKGLYNLFLIPATDIKNNSYTKPDYELSKLILASLSTTSPLKLLRPGPYIITLYKPISTGSQGEELDILFIDLTDSHPMAIAEIIRTYKNKILDNNLEGRERLQSVRLSLLNIGLHIEDSIGFAKAAYAELQSAFFK